jgi:hypothetical protein
MDQCVTFNTYAYQGPQCVGVSWVPGRYGTGGSAAGSACYFKSLMDGPGVIQRFQVDSAQIVSYGNPGTTSTEMGSQPTVPVETETVTLNLATSGSANSGLSGCAIGGIVSCVLGGIILSALMW